MFSRRRFLMGVASFALSLPGRAHLTKASRIGYLAPGLPDDPELFQSFREGLRALGHIEGHDVVVEYRTARGRYENLSTLALELAHANVDIIVAPTTPAARAAANATSSIPIVFSIVSDPIGSGLVTNLSHPAGNITGISDTDVDVVGKRLDLLKQVVPHVKRIGAMGNPADDVWEPWWREVQRAADRLQIDISPVLIKKADELEPTFGHLNRRVQALLVAPQVFFGVRRKRVIDLILSAKLPSIHERRAVTEAGALMSYGPNYPALLRQAARHVHKILSGAKPSDLPVEQPTEYELVVNLKTAKLIGIAMPESIVHRADEVIRWNDQAHVTTLGLNRLGRRQGAELIQTAAGGRALPLEVLEQIAQHTDGVPLFIEELTKSVLESGMLRKVNEHYELCGPLPPLAVPSTLHDSLMARLDRLAPVREVAQVGACIGREFSYELLAHTCGLSSQQLGDALRNLVDTGLVYRRGTPPDAMYTFKHALIQDAAYESILKSRRQQIHLSIARVLESQFSKLVKSSPELHAMHFERAGLAREAVSWYLRAGIRAHDQSANREAVSHFERALNLLDGIQQWEDRPRLEMDLCAKLGVLFTALEGFMSPRAFAYCKRAHELNVSASGDESWMIASVCLSLHMAWTGRAKDGLALSAQLVHAASADRRQEMLARDAHGVALMYSGRFKEALVEWQKVLEHYDPKLDGLSAFEYGHDFGANALGMSAYMKWEMGYPERALELANAAIALARGIGHSFTLASAITFAGADFSYFLRDPQRALQFAREGEDLSRKHHFSYLSHTCSFHYGYCLTGQGRIDEGVDRMLAAIEAMKQLGARTRRTPRLIAQLAEALGNCGRASEGLRLLETSPDRLSGTRVRFAEIYRIEGDLRLAINAGDGSLAENCYREAITIAVEDGALIRQLRAATRLAMVWVNRGNARAAKSLLTPVYQRFSEGFNTPDLEEAKAVLDRLETEL